jgi:hypothetical protein
MSEYDERVFKALTLKSTSVEEPDFTADDYEDLLLSTIILRERLGKPKKLLQPHEKLNGASFPIGPDRRPEHPSAIFWREAAESLMKGTPPQELLIALFEEFAKMVDNGGLDVLGETIGAKAIYKKLAAARKAKNAEEILCEEVSKRTPGESFAIIKERARKRAEKGEINSPFKNEDGKNVGVSEDTFANYLDERCVNWDAHEKVKRSSQ